MNKDLEKIIETKKAPTKEKQRELLEAYRLNGDMQARNELITSNLKLALSLSLKYEKRESDSFEDVFQEAVSGIVSATDRYDLSQNVKFTSYAYFWAKEAINNFLDSNSRVKIPAGLRSLAYKMSQVEIQYLNEHDELPSDEEIAKELGVPLKTILAVRNAPNTSTSLHQLIGEEQDELEAMIADPKAKNPEDALLRAEGEEEVLRVFETHITSELTQKVLKLRFGLFGERKHTPEEVGELLGLTKAMVLKAEEAGKRKLLYLNEGRRRTTQASL